MGSRNTNRGLGKLDKLKISRRAWIVIAVCVFLMIAISIGVIYRAKAQQENELKAELLDLQQQLSQFQPENQAAQLEQLEIQLAEIEAEIKDRQGILTGFTNAIDSAEELYALAGSYGVEVNVIASSGLTDQNLLEVSFMGLPFAVKVNGPVPDIIAFISALSSEISTCMVESVSVTSGSEPQESSAAVQLTIYSYRGE